MRELWRLKVVRPVLALLKQGLTPEKLALTIALGIGLGLIPILGSTSVACALAAFVFGLNQPAMQAVNYLVYPLQILCLIPFFKLGSYLFQAAEVRIGIGELTAMVRVDFLGAVRELWTLTWHALFAWVVVATPLVLVLYFVLRPILTMALKRGEAV